MLRNSAFLYTLYFIIFVTLVSYCNGYVLLRIRPGPEIEQFEHVGDSYVRERRSQQQQLVSEDRLRRSSISHMLKQPILGMSQWWNNDHDQEAANYYY